MTAADRAALTKVSNRRRYDSGEFVFHQGEAAADAIVVMAGRLKLVRTSPDGREVLIELRGPGSLVGELGIVDGRPRSTAVRAMGPVDLLSIPSREFRRLLAERPSLSLGVLESVARRLRQTVERRSEASNVGVLAQLCGRLMELADGLPLDSDGSVDLQLSLTQQEIADWLGVSRDAVVVVLQRLREEGLVETGRRRIRIVDPSRMRELAVSV